MTKLSTNKAQATPVTVASTLATVLLGIGGIGCSDDDDEPIAGWPPEGESAGA